MLSPFTNFMAKIWHYSFGCKLCFVTFLCCFWKFVFLFCPSLYLALINQFSDVQNIKFLVPFTYSAYLAKVCYVLPSRFLVVMTKLFRDLLNIIAIRNFFLYRFSNSLLGFGTLKATTLEKCYLKTAVPKFLNYRKRQSKILRKYMWRKLC